MLDVVNRHSLTIDKSLHPKSSQFGGGQLEKEENFNIVQPEPIPLNTFTEHLLYSTEGTWKT